jgi:hypothetical protein
VEDILAIIFIFGGGTAVLLDPDPALYDEIDRLRIEMSEVHERLDFAERLLADGRSPADPRLEG